MFIQALKKRRGGMLVELAITLILVGVVGISLGITFTKDTYAVQGAFLQWVSDLRFAQKAALVTGQVYGFRNLTDHTYEIYVGAPGTPAVNPSTGQNFIVDLSTSYPNAVFPNSSPDFYRVEYGAGGSVVLGGGNNYSIQSSTSTKTLSVENNTGVVRKL